MALWFYLHVNRERIGGVEIRRREHLDLSDPAAIANVWSTYDVRRDGALVGQVRHCYGHGAWRLLALAADLIAEERDEEFKPHIEHVSPETWASVLAVVDASYRPGLDVRLEGDDEDAPSARLISPESAVEPSGAVPDTTGRSGGSESRSAGDAEDAR